MIVSVTVGQPLTLWRSCGCRAASREKDSASVYQRRSSMRVRVRPARSVLAEAEARPATPALKVQIYRGGGDRMDDLQAEARALARAANASIYSPELLVGKYGSRPVKVFIQFRFLLLLAFHFSCFFFSLNYYGFFC